MTFFETTTTMGYQLRQYRMKLPRYFIALCFFCGLGIFIIVNQPMPTRLKQIFTKVSSPVSKEELISKGTSSTNASSFRGKVSNIYFLKIAKSGSTTMTNVLARFAWNHDLRVVTTKRPPWRRRTQAETSYFLDSLNPTFTVGQSEKYNMFIDHSHYLPDTINKFVYEPITYVAIVRHPFNRYLYFLNMDVKSQSVRSFLYKLESCSSCKLSIPRVKLRHYLKTPHWFGINDVGRGIKDDLKKLDQLFLVGITEHYDESMVLMRRKLGWSLRDVLYYPIHSHDYKRTEITESFYKQLCTFLPKECELYEHFNNSFWKMVKDEGENFYKEVMQFKSVLHKLFDFCNPAYKRLDSRLPVIPSTKIKIEGSEWNEPFEITYMDCAQMRLTDKSFRPFFFYKQNSNFTCDSQCNLNLITQERCAKICKATKISRAMELYTNASLNPLSD